MALPVKPPVKAAALPIKGKKLPPKFPPKVATAVKPTVTPPVPVGAASAAVPLKESMARRLQK